MEKLQLPLCLAVEATSLSSGYDILQCAWCSSYYVENSGNPYQKQMEECIDLIMNEPYTVEVLVDLGKDGVKSLLAVPFCESEHIETLEEIDMEYRELALESGIENWGRVPALGLTTSFITDLADAVIESLPSAEAMWNPSAEDSESPDAFSYFVKMFF
uniref:Uncharacterized protein n=1 Tax=Brassica oleracea var. oleracea TaxID=109376 RepID=A0A0D3E1B0_BRAOL